MLKCYFENLWNSIFGIFIFDNFQWKKVAGNDKKVMYLCRELSQKDKLTGGQYETKDIWIYESINKRTK